MDNYQLTMVNGKEALVPSDEAQKAPFSKGAGLPFMGEPEGSLNKVWAQPTLHSSLLIPNS